MSLNLLRSRLTALAPSTVTSRLALVRSPLRSNNNFPSSANLASPATRTRTMSSIPSNMKAILLTEAGGTDKLLYTDSHPVPKLNDGQILVKNNITGINFIDIYFRSGLYPSPSGYPLILGQEGAGTVAAVQGNSQGLKEGDRVVWIKSGGYAEYTAVAADRAIKIPSGLSDEEAVGGFLMGMTALSLVKEAYGVKKGTTVLVHAAAGGMGLLLCQILRDIGAYTIGTASTQEKCDLAKSNGADVMVNYKDNENWVDEVKKLTDGKGVDVVFDSVGKTTWEGSLEAAKRKGKGKSCLPRPDHFFFPSIITDKYIAVVYWGNASGPVPPIDLTKLSAKNVSIMRSTLMNYIVTREELVYYADMALGLVKDGKLKVRIHKVYDLKDAAKAQDDIEGRGTTGKLLLKC